jgi:magnesium transporter
VGERVQVKRRTRELRRRMQQQKPPGTSPGTLIVDPDAPKPILSVIAYGPKEIVERVVTDPAELKALQARFPLVWLNVDGLGDAATLLKVGEVFGLHKLALEDVLDVNKRAKVDRYDEYLYIVAVMVAITENGLDIEQLSLFLGKNFVITFQERPGDCFERVRERLRSGKGLIRQAGPGYLTYALLDATIDAYFPVLESYGERLEGLENALVDAPGQERLPEIHAMRRDLVALRRAIWPMREALNFLIREGTDAFTPETRPYLNDCYDHTVQLMDLVESHREMASGMMDVYLSSMSNRMNEIMKVLTIISTIFIPLTFIAGVYGMNFDPRDGPLSMPELRSPYGYIAVLGLMATIAIGMLFYFRRLGWIGRSSRKRP